MKPAAALAQLRDIHLPLAQSPPSTLPVWIAPLIVCCLAALLCFIWHKRRNQRWLQQSRAELTTISQLAGQGNGQRGWQRLAVLMRQLAIHLDPDSQRQAVTGQHWQAGLDELLSTRLFTEGKGALITLAPYLPPAAFNHDQALVDVCKEIDALLVGYKARRPAKAKMQVTGSPSS